MSDDSKEISSKNNKKTALLITVVILIAIFAVSVVLIGGYFITNGNFNKIYENPGYYDIFDYYEDNKEIREEYYIKEIAEINSDNIDNFSYVKYEETIDKKRPKSVLCNGTIKSNQGKEFNFNTEIAGFRVVSFTANNETIIPRKEKQYTDWITSEQYKDLIRKIYGVSYTKDIWKINPPGGKKIGDDSYYNSHYKSHLDWYIVSSQNAYYNLFGSNKELIATGYDAIGESLFLYLFIYNDTGELKGNVTFEWIGKTIYEIKLNDEIVFSSAKYKGNKGPELKSRLNTEKQTFDFESFYASCMPHFITYLDKVADAQFVGLVEDREVTSEILENKTCKVTYKFYVDAGIKTVGPYEFYMYTTGNYPTTLYLKRPNSESMEVVPIGTEDVSGWQRSPAYRDLEKGEYCLY